MRGTLPQELCGDVLLQRVRPGQQAREELFDLSPEWAYLNHGSYGATLRYKGGNQRELLSQFD